jgi:hypothetical protein
MESRLKRGTTLTILSKAIKEQKTLLDSISDGIITRMSQEVLWSFDENDIFTEKNIDGEMLYFPQDHVLLGCGFKKELFEIN